MQELITHQHKLPGGLALREWSHNLLQGVQTLEQLLGLPRSFVVTFSIVHRHILNLLTQIVNSALTILNLLTQIAWQNDIEMIITKAQAMQNFLLGAHKITISDI